MAAMQRPIDLAVLQQPSGPPAWETIPSWFIIGKQDNTIPADLHRFMAQRAGAVRTIELRASHAVMISTAGRRCGRHRRSGPTPDLTLRCPAVGAPRCAILAATARMAHAAMIPAGTTVAASVF